MMRIFRFFFLCLLVSSHLFGLDVNEALENLPQDEKDKMASFFDYAIKIGHAGHVLYFHNKPVCLIGMHCDAECDSTFREGWLIFKKNKNLFPSESFIFEERIKFFPTSKAIQIYVINKMALVNCINSHSEMFQRILGREVSGEIFLQELENGKHLTELIHDNEILLGILLGYGEESSKAYYKNRYLSKKKEKHMGSYAIITSEMTEDIEIFPVAFMGNTHSQEAARINMQFEEERKALWDTYLKKNQDATRFFLEAFCR